MELQPEPALEPEPEPEPEPVFDRYGLATDSDHAQVYSREGEESAKETERETKWAKMLGAWELYAGHGATKRRAAKLKRRVRKGIPVEHRGRAWFLLCGAREQMAANAISAPSRALKSRSHTTHGSQASCPVSAA